MGSSQAPSESALLSLLSQPPKDLKQTVIELSEPEQALKKVAYMYVKWNGHEKNISWLSVFVVLWNGEMFAKTWCDTPK